MGNLFRTTGGSAGLTARRFYALLASLSAVLAVILAVPPITRFAALFFAVLALCALGMTGLLRMMTHTTGWLSRTAERLYAMGTALFALFLLTFVAVQLLLLRGAHTDPEAEQAQYLLVLGAGIDGDQPSQTLRLRLEAARDCALRNPDCVLVVCGGQGADEAYPEAVVMRRWLVGQGIAESRILEEDRSVNTIENIANAKRMLDEIAPDGYTTAVVSSGFHLFRARHLMAQAGLSPTAVAAPSPWHLRPVFCLREYFSLVILAAANRW
jgi:uncharacterized SAM-binding protein YcdF (DUF218 family)